MGDFQPFISLKGYPVSQTSYQFVGLVQDPEFRSDVALSTCSCTAIYALRRSSLILSTCHNA
jgi:hypothetical protein